MILVNKSSLVRTFKIRIQLFRILYTWIQTWIRISPGSKNRFYTCFIRTQRLLWRLGWLYTHLQLYNQWSNLMISTVYKLVTKLETIQPLINSPSHARILLYAWSSNFITKRKSSFTMETIFCHLYDKIRNLEDKILKNREYGIVSHWLCSWAYLQFI